jgi:hypothetical protein
MGNKCYGYRVLGFVLSKGMMKTLKLTVVTVTQLFVPKATELSALYG